MVRKRLKPNLTFHRGEVVQAATAYHPVVKGGRYKVKNAGGLLRGVPVVIVHVGPRGGVVIPQRVFGR